MKYCLVLFFCFASLYLHAEENSSEGGWLKKRIKARIMKRLESRPAPTVAQQCSTKIETAGDYICSVKVDDLQRYFKIHVPQTFDFQKDSPLVLSFHGGGGNMDIQSNDRYYGLTAKSDQEKYIAVFPNGYSAFASGDLATWNAGDCCGDARDKKIDDVKFIKSLLDKVKSLLPVDTNRVFATGMSNGGMMAYRLACEAPELFQAIAPVAGTDVTVNCKPTQSVSILHIHAKDDDHVLYNGGAGKNAFKDRTKITEFTSVATTISKWKDLNQCKAGPVSTLSKKDVNCETYSDCKNETSITLCTTKTGGHSWPGGKKPLGGKSSAALNATDVIWDFFKKQK